MNTPLIEQPALLLALLMALTLVVPFVCVKLRVPEIVGLIAAGMIAGPYGLHWIAPDSEGKDLVSMLGYAGLLYLMFQSGLETDLHQFLRARRRSFGFGLLTFAIPLIGGTLFGLMLDRAVRKSSSGGALLRRAVFYGRKCLTKSGLLPYSLLL